MRWDCSTPSYAHVFELKVEDGGHAVFCGPPQMFFVVGCMSPSETLWGAGCTADGGDVYDEGKAMPGQSSFSIDRASNVGLLRRLTAILLAMSSTDQTKEDSRRRRRCKREKIV